MPRLGGREPRRRRPLGAEPRGRARAARIPHLARSHRRGGRAAAAHRRAEGQVLRRRPGVRPAHLRHDQRAAHDPQGHLLLRRRTAGWDAPRHLAALARHRQRGQWPHQHVRRGSGLPVELGDRGRRGGAPPGDLSRGAHLREQPQPPALPDRRGRVRSRDRRHLGLGALPRDRPRQLRPARRVPLPGRVARGRLPPHLQQPGDQHLAHGAPRPGPLVRWRHPPPPALDPGVWELGGTR
jgi:hypothetical protein